MYLDYSKIPFDHFGRPETPTLFLQTLSGDTLGVIPGVSNLSIRVKFSEPSEMEFDVAAKIEIGGELAANPLFGELTGQRVIHTKVYGNYIIINPEDNNDGINDTIHIKAFSLEKHWEKKLFFLEEGTFNFWNPVDSENTILGRMIEIMPEWRIGYVSPTLIGKYRTFDQYDDYLLDFAYSTIPEKYRCVCVFDTYEKTISAYDVDEQYDTIPIYLDFDNLLKETTVNELTDELVTAISPYGEDDLDIRSVNPIGSNWIYDLDYFIFNGDIPTALGEKWDEWQFDINNRRQMYYGLVALKNSKTAQLMAESANVVDMQGILTGYENQRSITTQAINMETTEQGKADQEAALEDINEQISDQQAAIDDKRALIASIEEDIASYDSDIEDIVSELRFTTYFTEEEQNILSNYLIEMTLTENTFISTDFSTSGAETLAAGQTTGEIEITNSDITKIQLDEEYGKVMYTFEGGSLSHSGDFEISGDIIRGTLEVQSSGFDFVFTAYMGALSVDESARPSGIITLIGQQNNETDDIAIEYDGDVHYYKGTEMSFNALQDTTLYVSGNVGDYEKYAVQLELYDYAKATLKDLASPAYEFSIESGNFIFAQEFEAFRNQLQLGRGVHLNLGNGDVITPYLIELSVDFEEHEQLDLVFSSRFKRHDQVNTLKEMIERSYSSSRSFDASKYTYNQTVNKQSEVDKFMSGELNAARNTILAAADQSVIIDGAGIRVNGNIQDGNTNKDVELRIVNGMIAMSDDNWSTAKLAIGYFKDTNGAHYGVNADVIAGKLLVGNNLVIENETDQGVMQFKVDQTGAWLYNSQLLLQSDDGGGIMIHPDYGFVVGGDIAHPLYTTSGTTVTPSFIDGETGEIIDQNDDGMPDNVNFYIDTEGNVSMKGNILADSGDIGGWIIDDNMLYSGNNTTYVALNTSGSNTTSAYAIWAGNNNAASAPFFVKRDGTVRIQNGDFSGNLTAASGTFAGLVSGGQININDNFVVDSQGNVTLNGNITWGPGTDRPVGQIYALYARTQLSKPTNAYNTYPATNMSGWHKTLDASNDYFTSYSYDNGVTWTDAIKTRGSDGTPGSGATVTRNAIVDAMLDAETQDGLYTYTINGTRYLGINAASINTGRISSASNNNNWWDLDTGELHVSGNSISITAGDAVSTAINTSVNSGIAAANSYTDSELSGFATTVSGYVNNLQGQIDGQFVTYYENYEPKLNNYPANDWDADEMEMHEGDLFYWKTTGYAYRFTYENDTYKWAFIQDSDIVQALADAEDAYDLADKKRRVFTSQPVPPYDAGDLWMQGANGDIMTCMYTNGRAAGTQYVESDWVKLNKYTDDTALTTWKNGEYAATIRSIRGQVDSKIETFYQTENPASGWTTDDLKSYHKGDLWYNPTEGVEKYYQWTLSDGTYSWQELTATPPSAVFDKIDTKRQVFVSQPLPPYEVGDLWTQGSTGDLYRCAQKRTSGSYVASDWVLATKYTDNSALNTFLANTYASDLQAIGQQIDKRAETFYQSADPSTTPSPGWNTQDLRNAHTGDLWYCTDTNSNRYQKYYRWDGIAWQEMTATPPGEVFDEIDGKAQIFVSEPVPPYAVGDLWFNSASSDIMTCVIARESGSYVESDWAKRNKYTDDSAVENLVIGSRNLLINTLTPDVSTASKRPKIIGQSTDTAISSNTTITTATHGVKLTTTTAAYPMLRFGSSTVSTGAMNGLTPGETYTFSFDTAYRLYSGSTSASTTYYYRLYLYTATASATSWTTSDYYDVHTYATSDRTDRGAQLEGRAEWTFDIPEDAAKCYIAFRSSGTTASLFATGDYIEFSNMKLERGSKATDWTPSPEDIESEMYTLHSYVDAVTDGIGEQIDGIAEQWFYSGEPTANNEPTVNWTTTELKDFHVGDWYYDVKNGYAYKYTKSGSTYSWVKTNDSGVQDALSNAATAKDTADKKRRVFTTTPYTPYDVGDLWMQGSTGDIMTCTTAKATGSYTASNWTKMNKYTDDSALNTFRTGEYSTAINSINSQLDLKADTYYQSTPPSNSWAQSEYTEHIGDLWYDTVNGISKMWDGSGWVESDIPEEVYDKIDSKAQIFVGETTPVNPQERDLWFPGENEPILTYVKVGQNYQWVEYNKYTDDSAVDNLSIGGRNLLINTLQPDVSSAAKRPRIAGQTVDSVISGSTTLTVAAHGIRLTTTSAVRPYYRFGSYDLNTKSMNGLEIGQEYTLSFDTSYKLFSGSPSTSTDYYYRLYLYTATASATSWTRSSYYTVHTFSKSARTDRGAEFSDRVEWTFEVPSDIAGLYILLAPDSSTANHYASGDYMEFRNMKLERGNKASDWTPAPEDVSSAINELQDYIDGDFIDTISAQIDSKADTWYQAVRPDQTESWTADEKASHTGDMWFNTTDNKSYVWNGTGWVQSDVPQGVYDQIDGRAQIFTGTTTPTDANNGDLWFKGVNEPILTYVNNAWVEYNKYTDDSAVDNLVLGGGNLLRWSDFSKCETITSNAEWSTGGFTMSSGGNATVSLISINDAPVPVSKAFRFVGNTSGNKDIQQRNIPLEANTDYTFSAYIRINSGTTASILSRFWDRAGSKPVQSTTTELTGTGWQRFTITKDTGTMTNGKYDFSIGVTGTSADIEICAPQLEMGTKATAWGLSSWDRQEEIAEVNNWIATDFAATINEVRGQIDGKADTFYQSADPAEQGNWVSGGVSREHDGDLWYCTNPNNASRYQKTFRWDGVTSNQWQELTTNPPSAVFDEIDGKAQIFTGATLPAGADPNVGDLWFPGEDDPILTYVETSTNVFEWVEYNKYTEMIKNIKIGGRNLLLDTNAPSLTKVAASNNRYFSDINNTTVVPTYIEVTDAPIAASYGVQFAAANATSTNVGRCICWYSGLPVPMVDGEVYTMSAYARVTSGSKMRLIFQYGVNAYPKEYVDITDTEWKQYSWTFDYSATDASDTSGTGARVYIGIRSYFAGTVEMCGFRLEKGLVATDWDVAPEDDEVEIRNYIDSEIDTVEGMIDGKAETFYQNADPSSSWSSADYSKHEGDLWYCTNSSSNKYQKYYRWNGTAWQELTTSPPSAVATAISNKANIFTGTSTPTGAKSGDLWFQGADSPVLTYVNGTWTVYNMYTDDSALKAGYGGDNLLIDASATSLTKVNASWDRYFSDETHTGTTGVFIEEDSLPDNSTHFVRLSNVTGTGARAYAFYRDGQPPILDGHYYSMSCYARSTTGPTTLRLRFSGNNGNMKDFTVSDNWEKCEYTAKFVDSGSTVTTYKRTYFGIKPTAVGQSLDMCGFYLRDVTDEVMKSQVVNDNLLPRTKDLACWSRYSGVTIEKDPNEDGINIFHYPAATTVDYRDVTNNHPSLALPYALVRGKTVTLSFWVKCATASDIANNAFVVFSLTTAPQAGRTKYSSNQVPSYALQETTDWQKVVFTTTITDALFTSGSGTITDDLYFYIQFYNHSTSESWMKKPKLEFGGIETEWCPNSHDDIQGGGRNLLRHSDVNITNSSTYNIAVLYFGAEQPIAGSPYVLQIKGSLGSDRVGWGVYNSGGTVYEGNYNADNKGASPAFYNPTTGIYTIVIPSWKIVQGSTTAANDRLALYQIPNSGTSTSSIEWVKLETGTVPTSWTPAPEDVDDKISDVKIGGRNLILNGDFSKGASKWSNWGTPTTREIVTINGKNWLHCVTTTANYQGYSQQRNTVTGLTDIEPNTEYTLSFTMYASAAYSGNTCGIHWKNGSTIVSQSWQSAQLTTTPQRYSFTFTSGAGVNTCNVMVGKGSSSTALEYWVTDIQLEKGNKASDWMPAQEDITESISTAQSSADSALAMHATCITPAGTAAKEATSPTFTLSTGAVVSVLFTNKNTANDPTLNVNYTGAKPIKYLSPYTNTLQTLKAADNFNWIANSTVDFRYSGSEWVILDSNSTLDQTRVFNAITRGQNNQGLYLTSDGNCYVNASYIKAGTLSADYIGATSITAEKIASNAITADKILAGTITANKLDATDANFANLVSQYIRLHGEMTVYTDSTLATSGGKIGYGAGSLGDTATNGIKISNTNGNFYLIVTDTGVRMSAGDSYYRDIFISSNGPVMRFNGNEDISVTNAGPTLRYQNTKIEVHHGTVVNVGSTATSLGSSGYKWSAVYASTGTIQTSDRKQKYDISYDIDKYIDVFDYLKPVSYKLIDGQSGRTHLGMIAQDIEETIDDLGISSVDFAAFIKEQVDGVDVYGLRYEEFIPILIAKMQQQQKQIDDLTQKVKELE